MANQASIGTAGGHQQSIGEEDGQIVDGIAGTHPGTQEPSGAHVDAGDPGPAAGPLPEATAPGARQGIRAPAGSPSRGMSGMSGQGIAQPGNTTGALGSHAQQRVAQSGSMADSLFAGNWTGSLIRGGKAIGVATGGSTH